MAYADFHVTTEGSVSDVNGGGPSLGTAGAPVYTTADSTVAGGALTTVVDNSGSDWAGASVDDWLCWDAAGVKEFRRITVLAGPNATIHAAATAAANKTTNVGGAWATVDHGLSTIDTTFVNAAGDFPCLNVKEGTYAESVVVDNSGTLAIPITCEGYKTTAHDNPPLANLPEIDADGTAATAFDANARSYIVVRRLYAHTDGAAKYAFDVGSDSLYDSCRGHSTNHKSFYYTGTRNNTVNCWSSASGDRGFDVASILNSLYGCVSTNAGSYGFNGGAYETFIACIADTPTDDCFRLTDDTCSLYGCVGYKSTAGSGVRCTDLTGERQPAIMNCIFAENNQYGIEIDAAQKYLLHENFNAFYNNGVAATLNCLEAGDNDVTLTGDPFVDAANGDFRLNTTAGAGLACKMTGFPGLLLDGVNRGHADIGALQML